ncbi:MAG: hypothetical protein ACR2LU_02050, partial [Luteitalea sp.]
MTATTPHRTPVRWVSHKLNGALVFGGSYYGARYLPLPLAVPLAHGFTWLVGRALRETTAAVMDNLRVVFPHETNAQLRRRAYGTFHSYT